MIEAIAQVAAYLPADELRMWYNRVRTGNENWTEAHQQIEPLLREVLERAPEQVAATLTYLKESLDAEVEEPEPPGKPSENSTSSRT